MNFTTKFSIPESDHPISYNSKVVLLGSCFSETIGSKFEYFKFQTTVNPFGIIFNPIAIDKLIARAVLGTPFSEQDIFYHEGLWKCYDVHSDLNAADKTVYLSNLNQIVHDFKMALSQASHLIITYGTAWVYRHIAIDKIVANCHKVPQNQFTKEIVPTEVLAQSIQNTIDLIATINPTCQVVFTISPVRHLKDGFVENQRSKAHLIAAIHNLQFRIHNYFPSYEIMMDELREYRFYAEDMIHPSITAINYIWERFSTTYFTDQTSSVMHEVDAIQKALLHRVINKDTASHQRFLDNVALKKKKIMELYPQIIF